MKSFASIIKVLYNTDCISDQAIIYWHQKGAKPQGKQHFLKATEALVKVSRLVGYKCCKGAKFSSSKSRTRTRTSRRWTSRTICDFLFHSSCIVTPAEAWVKGAA